MSTITTHRTSVWALLLLAAVAAYLVGSASHPTLAQAQARQAATTQDLTVVSASGGDQAVIIDADGFVWTVECRGTHPPVTRRASTGSYAPIGNRRYVWYHNFLTGEEFTEIGKEMIARSEIDAAGGLESYLKSQGE